MGKSPKICACGERSLTGLVPGVALCQYHFGVKMYGKDWADMSTNKRGEPWENWVCRKRKIIRLRKE